MVFTALAHALGPSAHVLPGPPGSPASSLFDFLLVTMRVLCLPLLFLAMILTMQARVIAGLRAMIARDGLTGALSRGTLMEEGERIFAECVARQEPAAFLLLDLDFFKQINDQYGHACGDMALAHFADTVSAFLAGRGVLGRIGGEEFGIVLPDHTEEQARALAEDICRVVRETPAGRSHQRIRLTVSIGIAAAIAGETITDVMIRADLALYDSKADGRDRCSVARDRRIDASARALAAAAGNCAKPVPPGRNCAARRDFSHDGSCISTGVAAGACIAASAAYLNGAVHWRILMLRRIRALLVAGLTVSAAAVSPVHAETVGQVGVDWLGNDIRSMP